MNTKIVLTNLFLWVAVLVYSNQTDPLLKVLDLSIKNRGSYILDKKNYLKELKNQLENAGSKQTAYLSCVSPSIDYKKSSARRYGFAKLFLDEKDTKRVYEYINIVLGDVRKFNNGHRPGDTERTHSLAQNAYHTQMEQQQDSKIFLLFIIAVFIVSGIIIIFFYRKNRKLKQNRSVSSESILNLQEDSYILKAFVGHYLDLYHSYVIKSNEYRKYILMKLNDGKGEDFIRSETSRALGANSNYDEIFSDFDKMFLSIYPNFVTSVNSLLKEPDRYNLKSNKKKSHLRLNTEIRILALLKLGVSDNTKMASFLRISVQSINSSRSKIKAKAIDENSFEKDIESIRCILI